MQFLKLYTHLIIDTNIISNEFRIYTIDIEKQNEYPNKNGMKSIKN